MQSADCISQRESIETRDAMIAAWMAYVRCLKP